jgi:hypothetical protein
VSLLVQESNNKVLESIASGVWRGKNESIWFQVFEPLWIKYLWKGKLIFECSYFIQTNYWYCFTEWKENISLILWDSIFSYINKVIAQKKRNSSYHFQIYIANRKANINTCEWWIHIYMFKYVYLSTMTRTAKYVCR